MRNLGFHFDKNLTGNVHIEKVCANCFGVLKLIRKVRKSICINTCKLLVNNLVLSKIDYCNSVLAGSPDYLIRRLQKIQNMACRIIFNLQKYDHISIHMKQLHWLKVRERIKFKIALLVFQCIHGSAPSYLQSLLSQNRGPYNLRSRVSMHLTIHHCTNTQARNGAFHYIGPRVWNSLPSNLRQITNLEAFKRALKAHLFKQSYPFLDA